MKRGSVRLAGACGFAATAIVGAVAMALVFGIAATGAYADPATSDADGLTRMVVEEPPETSQESGQAEDQSAVDSDDDGGAQASAPESADAEAAEAPAGSVDVPELDIRGPKATSDLDIQGPKVGDAVNGKLPKIDPPDCHRGYIDENGEPATSPEVCSDLSRANTGWLPLKSGWYCFSRSVTLSGRAAVEGDVRIILCDGAIVTWKGGLHMLPGSKLTVYGQTEGTGELIADATERDNEAGIGGNQLESSTEVVVCGGHVHALGGEDAAGIGGGGDKWVVVINKYGGNGGKVTVYGGAISAIGKGEGDGIGGGCGGEGGSFTIFGGRVYARGGEDGGVGIAAHAGEDNTKAFRILGGEVTAYGRRGESAIEVSGENAGVDVIIENAKVTTSCESYGDGINVFAHQGSSITIRNSFVSAKTRRQAAAIRCYCSRGSSRVSIEGDSVVDAKSEKGAAFACSVDCTKGDMLFAEHLKVISYDNDGKEVTGGERKDYCLYRHHVRVEPGDQPA